MRLLQRILGLGLVTVVIGNSNLCAAGLEDLRKADGSALNLESPKNKVFVLFWASWCTTCKEKLATTLPALDQSPEVAVLTVNADKEIKRAEHYIAKNKVLLPVYFDPDKKIRSELKIFSVPHWAVYSRTHTQAAWKLEAAAPAFETESINQALGKKYL